MHKFLRLLLPIFTLSQNFVCTADHGISSKLYGYRRIGGDAEKTGVENAGVENTEAMTYGRPSKQKTLYQECMLKRSGLRRSLDDAHEQRPNSNIPVADVSAKHFIILKSHLNSVL